MAKLHVGLSGFSYLPWRGEARFYPPELKPDRFLGFYSTRYDSVEMDQSFYQLPKETAIQQWLAGTPESFTFCFKGHRWVTHLQRLKLTGLEGTSKFLERIAPVAAAGKLGPTFFQLPPNLKRDDERLRAFLDTLPRSLPNGHPLRWAMEFRNDTWNVPEVEEILRANSVAWVASDADEWQVQLRDTSDFRYARIRRSSYTMEALAKWRSFFEESVAAGRDCFVFCKHEDEGAPWVCADAIMGKG